MFHAVLVRILISAPTQKQASLTRRRYNTPNPHQEFRWLSRSRGISL